MHHSLTDHTSAGKNVAREMYGIEHPRAWVAHGFTDGYMGAGLYGDNQWALCVTCGAWAALHQWESLVYSSSAGKVGGSNGAELFRVINTLRGVALFFKEYTFRVEGPHSTYTVHTGPTTSPENSYVLLVTGTGMSHVFDLVFVFERIFGWCFSFLLLFEITNHHNEYVLQLR